MDLTQVNCTLWRASSDFLAKYHISYKNLHLMKDRSNSLARNLRPLLLAKLDPEIHFLFFHIVSLLWDSLKS